MTPGAVLAARRGERGLTIRSAAAATRIRPEYLSALEAGDLQLLPGPVYVKGYLRTYARYLGVDPEPLVEMLHVSVEDPRRRLGIGPQRPHGPFVVTAPAVIAAAVVLLAGAFAGYAWRQLQADQRAAGGPPPAQLAVASPPTTPLPSPTPQPQPIVVGIRVTDLVWVNVIVDGKPQYADAGKMLSAGSVVYFTGLDVKITSGKAGATYITIDGRSLGPLGAGVATREFTSQTSP
jgi:cytoskeleton protein RodZ